MSGAPAAVQVRWVRGLEFDCSAPGRGAVRADGDSDAGPSPVELLLMAAAACSAADVVAILEKARVLLRSLDVAVHPTRRDTPPRRLTAVHFVFRLAGQGADETKARRAIDLSLEKYCSVVASLAPDTQVTYDVAVA